MYYHNPFQFTEACFIVYYIIHPRYCPCNLENMISAIIHWSVHIVVRFSWSIVFLNLLLPCWFFCPSRFLLHKILGYIYLSQIYIWDIYLPFHYKMFHCFSSNNVSLEVCFVISIATPAFLYLFSFLYFLNVCIFYFHLIYVIEYTGWDKCKFIVFHMKNNTAIKK